MTSEAIMIILDNSSACINGDYYPTRWDAQIEAASLLIQSKLQSNTQSSIGLALMAGKQVQILCSPHSDCQTVNSYLWGIKIGGQTKFSKILQTATLALKHRLNTSQKQRIICFIGSTLQEETEDLAFLGKKLKKNSIAVDIIAFGDLSRTQKFKINKFIDSVQSQQNSNAIFIEPTDNNLSDYLLQTRIFGNTNNLGNQNPELELALRLSLEEYNREVSINENIKNKTQSNQETIKQVIDDQMEPEQIQMEKIAKGLIQQHNQSELSLLNQKAVDIELSLKPLNQVPKESKASVDDFLKNFEALQQDEEQSEKKNQTQKHK